MGVGDEEGKSVEGVGVHGRRMKRWNMGDELEAMGGEGYRL